MTAFSYKTRNDSPPQGKARVYFCALSEDYHLLDSVSQDILKHANCTVWYRNDEGSQCNEEHLFHLSQMQLFVIPVTPGLLSGGNRVTDVEFPFAQKNGIPVLPLIQAGVSDEDYCKYFGKLQYLNKNTVDNTALSFDEKMISLLRQTLFGSDEVEAVRKAFRSYAFLSYRKKDRALAQRLMKTIHSFDAFWDVAIWYDEFITPGEDFSQNISDALEKSELFLLNVTPNLLEKNNYVATHEYPMALCSKKPILPIVTQKVELSQIESAYPGIPECVGLENQERVGALLQLLLCSGNISSYGEEEKRYYIGLAYLNGIDVEIDRKKAISLITASAESGFFEAQRTMVRLYRNGIGVDRDFSLALIWQERLVEQLKENYIKNTADPRARANCLDECFRLARMYCEERAYENVKELLSFCQGVQVVYNTIDNLNLYDLLSIGRCYVELGELYSVQQNHEQALENYKQALYWCSFVKLDESLPNKLDSPEFSAWSTVVQNVSACFGGIGSASLALGLLDEARRAFCQAELLLGRIDRGAFSTEEAWNILSYNRACIYMNLGQIYGNLGQNDTADGYFSKSIEHFKLLCEESGEDKYRRFLSIAYNRYGSYLLSCERLIEARSYFEQSTEIIRSLIDGSSPELKRDLAITLEMTAGSYAGENCPIKTVIDLLAEAVALREELTDVLGTGELIYSYTDILDVYVGEKMVEEAFGVFDKVMKCYKGSDDKSITPDMIRSVSHCCTSLGKMCDGDGVKDTARVLYLNSVQLNRKVALMTQEADDLSEFAFSCMTLATMPPSDKSNLAKGVKESLSLIETAFAVYSKLSGDYPENPEYAQKLSSVRSTYSLYKMLSGSVE